MDKGKRQIAVALFISMFLVAFDGTVMATAAPNIAENLGDFQMVSWIFTLYLFLSAVTTPIYGKLADLFGRRNTLICGITIFMLGSMLCGLASSMHTLVMARAVQGLGAGAVLTINFTIIGDIYTLRERAAIQGGVSTIWGVAGLLGPMLGGLFIDYLSWHWIFFINIPFCLICITSLMLYLHEKKLQKKPSIDYLGAFLLTACLSSFLYGIMEGYKHGSSVLFSAAAAAVLLGFIFYKYERHVKEPIVLFAVLSRPVALNVFITFLVSVVLIGANVYVPMYVQLSMGYSATVAGFSMASMSLSWCGYSFASGYLLEHFGTRVTVTLSSIILTAASFLLLTLQTDSSIFTACLYTFSFGFAFAGTLNILMFMIQDSVPYSQRGATVSIASLAKAVAQAIGASLFGSILNIMFGSYLQKYGLYHLSVDSAGQLIKTVPLVHLALFSAFKVLFIIFAAFSFAALLFSLFLPRYHKRVESK